MSETRRIFAQGYLRACAVAVAALAVMALAVVLLIDPYGISPIGLSIKGVNAIRTERTAVDRLIKPLEALQKQPRSLILGTSRVKEGLDPSALNGTAFAPAYNAGIDFSSLTETGALLSLWTPWMPRLQTVFIEVNIFHFYNPAPIQLATSLPALASDAVRMTATYSAMTAAIRTVVKNRGYNDHRLWLRPDGLAANIVDGMLEDRENFFRNVITPSMRDGDFIVRPERDQMVDAIVDQCVKAGLRCVFFIAPYNPLDLGAYYLAARWSSYNAVKKYFVDRGLEIWDFTAFNPIISEPSAQAMTYWYDINHFGQNVGGWMLQTMIGQRPAQVPENFGQRLTAENYGEVACHWQVGIEDWLMANADQMVRLLDALALSAADLQKRLDQYTPAKHGRDADCRSLTGK